MRLYSMSFKSLACCSRVNDRRSPNEQFHNVPDCVAGHLAKVSADGGDSVPGRVHTGLLEECSLLSVDIIALCVSH